LIRRVGLDLRRGLLSGPAAGEYRCAESSGQRERDDFFSLAAARRHRHATMSPFWRMLRTIARRAAVAANSLGVHLGVQSSPCGPSGGRAFLHAPARWLALRVRVSSRPPTQIAGLSIVVPAHGTLARMHSGGLPSRQAGVDAWADSGRAGRAPTRCLARRLILRRIHLRRRCLGQFRSYRSTWLVLSAQAGGELFRLNDKRVQQATMGVSLAASSHFDTTTSRR